MSTAERIEIEERRQKALDRLFGTSDPLYLVGSDDHPQFPLIDDELVYPSDRNAAHKLKGAFFKDMVFKEVKDYIPEKTTGSLITFGSSVATPITRRYLGDPQRPNMVIKLPQYGYEANLSYNHLCPDDRAPLVNNFQAGRPKPWSERNWGIITAGGDELFPRVEQGWLVTDYLLVTRIPSPIRGAGDIIMFGGSHGAGTQATELLLGQLDYSELVKIINKIGDFSHFQALFLVTGISHNGHSCGCQIDLVDAKPVIIRREL